jgi:hypothetical protein
MKMQGCFGKWPATLLFFFVIARGFAKTRLPGL